MTLNSSSHKTARQAAVLYLALVAVAIYGGGYIPTKIFVRGDPVVTARNLISEETLFRIGILCHLATTTAIAVMVLLLYRLFRPIDRHLSRLMVAPVLSQVPVVVMLEVFHMAALLILKGEPSADLSKGQQVETSYLLMRMHGIGIGISQVFWGLWLFPFGMLIYKAALPRVFAILLFLNGLGYVTEGCAYVLLERESFLQVRQFTRISLIGLPLTMLWLLVKGIRPANTGRITINNA